MLGTVGAVRALTGATAEDFPTITSEDDLDKVIGEWLVQISEWITEDRERDFEIDGVRWSRTDTLLDPFDVDEALDGASAPTGQTWSADAGMVKASGELSGDGAATVPLGASDQDVEAVVTLTEPGTVSLIVRQAADHFTASLVLSENGDQWLQLAAVASGVPTTLAVEPVPTRSLSGVTLRVVARGNRFVALLGEVRAEAAMPDADPAATGVGIELAGATAAGFKAGVPPAVPAAVDSIAVRACANMVAQAMLRRNTPLVRIDELTVQLVEHEVFDQPVRDELKRWPRRHAFGMSVFSGR